MFIQTTSIMSSGTTDIPSVHEMVFYLDKDYADVANEYMHKQNTRLKTFEEIEQERLKIIIENIINNEILHHNVFPNH